MKTKIHDLEILKQALSDLHVNFKINSSLLKDFQGQTHVVDLVISQPNGTEIGFVWNGQYELIADLQFWNQPWSIEAFLDRLSQRYAYHLILKETQNQNFQIAQEENILDGSVRLVLQRWTF
uniref:Uncharacterized protein ycf35 n=1 Tax=Bangiopsis subsimplex TaxID=139980 RepID=A0A1C9CCJ5_9RHOD|nr:hypothetical protein Bangp_029 [Bangiopsis subsimplex]AOM66111.1 hypothetical protein Bangp_029 [Bangiopsis subsimplex]ARO90332.1 conserved hypothetical plastid protein [Bangiopsis subsimplex]